MAVGYGHTPSTLRLLYYLPMERMKHTGDYELDEINMLEQECADLEEENKRLEEENKKLKSDLANIQCEFWFECDECEYWKREMKKHKPNLTKEEYVFNLWDYDYMILTSTTPQLKIIKKKNKWASTFTIDWFTAVGKAFSSLADEEDLYEDVK